MGPQEDRAWFWRRQSSSRRLRPGSLGSHESSWIPWRSRQGFVGAPLLGSARGFRHRRRAPLGRIGILKDGIFGLTRFSIRLARGTCDKIAQAGAPGVTLASGLQEVGATCGGGRASQQPAIGIASNVLCLAKGAAWLGVVQRRDAHQRDFQLPVNIKQRVASRIGHAGNRVSADREGAAREVDFLCSISQAREDGETYIPSQHEHLLRSG